MEIKTVNRYEMVLNDWELEQVVQGLSKLIVVDYLTCIKIGGSTPDEYLPTNAKYNLFYLLASHMQYNYNQDLLNKLNSIHNEQTN